MKQEVKAEQKLTLDRRVKQDRARWCLLALANHPYRDTIKEEDRE